MTAPRPGWVRQGAAGRTCAGAWQHASGWVLRHCGHPTALWPYYLEDPQGRMAVSHTGRGFHHLVDAQLALEGVLAGQLELVEPSPDEALRAMDPDQARALRELRAVYPDGRLPRRRTRRTA